MVRIGTVWDRTVDVIRGRSGILAGLALLYVFLPSVVRAAFVGYATPGLATGLIGIAIAIAAPLLLIVGVLAITAVASDPAVGRAAATRIGVSRLGPALAVVIVAAVVGALIFAPAVVALVSAGATVDAAGNVAVADAAAGSLAMSALLLFVGLALAVWLGARLVPLFPVVVNERRGLGALRRSFALTRGTTAKLVGLMILYAMILLIVLLAATWVVGVVARLSLGAEAASTVAFVVAVVGAAVTAVATVVQAVFYAQYYVAARGDGGTDAAAA